LTSPTASWSPKQCECGYTYYDHENAEGSVTIITEGSEKSSDYELAGE
jgi:hypothetical protein